MRSWVWLAGLMVVSAVAGCGKPAVPAVAPQEERGAAGGLNVGQETTAPPEEAGDDAPAPPTPPAAESAPGLIQLEGLLPVPDPPPTDFPAVSVSDKDCVKSVGLTGNLTRDFEALTASCGASAGMKAYTRVAEGTLGAARSRETFSVKLLGGYCYRFFAMADGSIEKLNVRVERPNGALHSAISGKQPVVLYRPGEAWCRRRDRDFRIVVEAPAGEGRYAFGMWARPNPRGRSQRP
jgi:hypothetical protein